LNQPDDRASEVHDFNEILSNPGGGELTILVSGHAVNLWALYYKHRIEAVESASVNSRHVIVQMELARKITTSHGIDFRSIWPRELLATAKDRRFQNFVNHRCLHSHGARAGMIDWKRRNVI
jgi:hypothetical protein